MTSMPTAEDLRFAADMMRTNAEAWLTDESDGASDVDVNTCRAELAIVEFFLKHYGKADAAPDLLAELRETADWLTERANSLRQLADQAPGVMRKRNEHLRQLRDEAARLEGRAAVIRQTILKATQGA